MLFRSGHVDHLEVLAASSEVDLNQGDYDQRTPLHLAASEGMLETVQFCNRHGTPTRGSVPPSRRGYSGRMEGTALQRPWRLRRSQRSEQQAGLAGATGVSLACEGGAPPRHLRLQQQPCNAPPAR